MASGARSQVFGVLPKENSKMATELQVLYDFIRSEIGYEGALGPDIDLLEKQILDSFSIVQLAVFIQERFQIELEAEDLVRANLARLSNMIALIDRKKAAKRQLGDQGNG
jgi:acyl carrier protein